MFINHMGPAMSTNTASDRPLPASLSDVALIDAKTCAAVGGMSLSWWHAEVAAGRAPEPAIRKPRCTRWRVAAVRAFWIKSAEKSATDSEAADLVKAKATKASAKALALRVARAATVATGQ